MRHPFSTHWQASCLISTLVLAFALPAAAQTASTVRVGNETKKTGGTVVSLQNGDTACYLSLKNEQGVAFREMGDFELCSQKPSLVGKRVTLSYSVAKVMSDECQGDPNCKKFRNVVLVTAAKPVDDRPVAAVAGAHRCGPAAVRQAEKLMRFHALPDQAVQMDVGRTARAVGTVRSPAGGANFDVLEVDGTIYKARFRLRMLYGQIPGECLLVGQEILEITNL